jgi:hypothetical protein
MMRIESVRTQHLFERVYEEEDVEFDVALEAKAL